MAKGDKTKAVREYRAAHPNATGQEIADALAKTGTPVRLATVNNILWAEKKRPKAKRVRLRAKTGSPKVGKKTSQRWGEMQRFKQMVDAFGGIRAVKSALAALESLRK